MSVLLKSLLLEMMLKRKDLGKFNNWFCVLLSAISPCSFLGTLARSGSFLMTYTNSTLQITLKFLHKDTPPMVFTEGCKYVGQPPLVVLVPSQGTGSEAEQLLLEQVFPHGMPVCLRYKGDTRERKASTFSINLDLLHVNHGISLRWRTMTQHSQECGSLVERRL